MKSKFAKYFKEYTVSNNYNMIKNNRRDPKISNEEFKDKLVVISGATSGIGYATAKEYASHGANLLCINRNIEKSESLKTEIENEFQVECRYLLADLSKLEDIHHVADELKGMEKPIDVLIHNAGIHLTTQELTSEGIDKVFMVQYLSSFIINYKLVDKLKSQDKARIIMVNSEGHRFAAWGLKMDDLNWKKRRYSGLKSYGSAKLAQLLSMHVFDDIFKNSGVTINAMHPGAVKSETGKDNGPVYRWYKKNVLDKILRPVSISSEALYYLGTSIEMENISGKFFNLTTEEEPAPPALDKDAADEVWKVSLSLSGVQNTNPKLQ